ncbi:hypothetical protein BDV33DRAFT_201279 [Aspergillus novoparasiticus]|uniref:Uncharacterized protein n=1 Tax=Aspergillus novoparasiticus TaxID=986946 RepID=A0A5N6EYJ4_9EURO|nr:hypothetical protein BDV33DRAFT_201279 [Aspergillus novoparasiticus]
MLQETPNIFPPESIPSGKGKKILQKVAPGEQGTYYSTLIASNIRYDDSSHVSINKFLCVDFKSPATVADPWGPMTITTEKLREAKNPDGTFSVTLKLNIEGGHKFDPTDTITFPINGDITKKPDPYTSSFTLIADDYPDIFGTVNVECPDAPDQALKDIQQILNFTAGQRVAQITVALNKTTPVKLITGTYQVRADDLATQYETYVASAQPSPDSISLNIGETKSLKVKYGEVKKYSALDVKIGKISGLEDESFHVKVTNDGRTFDFTIPKRYTEKLRRKLPASGKAEIRVDPITVNNFEYCFKSKMVTLSPERHQIIFSQADVTTKKIDTSSFVELLVEVKINGISHADIPVRLTSQSFIYAQNVRAQSGTSKFGVPVKPGQYRVQAKRFVYKGIVYITDAPSTLDVKSGAKLQLSVRSGPNLYVPGFPKFLSFGGCADMQSTNLDDFAAARASSVFKYAGEGGNGDPTEYLEDDQATRKTITLARDVEKKLADGNPVLPVMISYTCDLSGGKMANLNDKEQLAHSFANFILSLKIAKETIDQNHPVPAGYIVNPDFIGMCQQKKLTPEHPMPVREPLETALKKREITAKIPGDLKENLHDYVRAVNWLVRTVAPEVTFGWQVNVWPAWPAGAVWIYDTKVDPVAVGNDTAEYAKKLGAFQTIDSAKPPDFLAIDRYERDDFTKDAMTNKYCYGPREWHRYFDFCEAISTYLQEPVMAWQIPSSHQPLVTDNVSDDALSQHWGTGGSYILGHPEIGSDYENIHPKIAHLPCNWLGDGNTVEDLFRHAEPFDLTDPAFLDFPQRGIFAILLGGGSTTGIISTVGSKEPWARKKLHEYMNNPIRY